MCYQKAGEAENAGHLFRKPLLSPLSYSPIEDMLIILYWPG